MEEPSRGEAVPLADAVAADVVSTFISDAGAMDGGISTGVEGFASNRGGDDD